MRSKGFFHIRADGRSASEQLIGERAFDVPYTQLFMGPNNPYGERETFDGHQIASFYIEFVDFLRFHDFRS